MDTATKGVLIAAAVAVIGHLVKQYFDGRNALQNELRKFGADLVEVAPNERYEVRPATAPISTETTRIDTYDDHRMAMSFGVTGLRAPGVRILDPGCTAKTFPDYFERLIELTGTNRLI